MNPASSPNRIPYASRCIRFVFAATANNCAIA